MIKLQRIKSSENEVVIYHYIYGDLLSVHNDRLNVWTEQEVKKKVFDIRESYYTYDFNVTNEGREVGICSIREIDYENRNAKLFITMKEEISGHESLIHEILNEMSDFAFGQLDLVRLEGYLAEDQFYLMKKRLLEKNHFQQEAVLDDINFINGTRTKEVIFGLLKEERVVESCGLREN